MPRTLLRSAGGLRFSEVMSGKGDEGSGALRTWYAAASEGISQPKGPLTAHVFEWFIPGLQESRL